MAKKFKCPKCEGKNIEQVTLYLRRVSDVISLDNMRDEEFLCSGARIEEMESTSPKTFYRCNNFDCYEYLGDTAEDVITKHFHEEQKLPPAPKPVKFETYKMKELKYCQGDGLSVRELIDTVNFLIHAGGNKFTVRTDSQQPASVACLKFIMNMRPYLFDKVQ